MGSCDWKFQPICIAFAWRAGIASKLREFELASGRWAPDIANGARKQVLDMSLLHRPDLSSFRQSAYVCRERSVLSAS